VTAARLRPAPWTAPLVYLLLACIGQLPALGSLTTMTRCSCRDTPQTDWFLGWTPHAIAAGQAPWTSTHLNAPKGVNLMWNTLLPLPGVLMAPVTAVGNVLASHTVLAILAFTLSATSMWWVARRWAPWPPARFAAGLLYGFSPYVVAQGFDHLNLQLVALPPLILLCLDELLVRQRRHPVGMGALLGLLALAQLLTTEEVLASTFIVCVVGLVVLLVQQRSALSPRRIRHALAGLTTAALLLTAGAAWPLAVQLGGHEPVTGEAVNASRYGADLLGSVVPGVHQALGFDSIEAWAGGATENGSYLGMPLLLLLGWVTWRYRRIAVVRFSAVLALVVLVLSLGRRLAVAGTTYDIPLPLAPVAHVKLLSNLAAVRLALYVSLFAALLLAVALDRLHRHGSLARHRWRAAAIGLLVVVSLVPDWPYHFERTRTPAYFTSAQVERIPRDAVALVYPVPRFPSSEAMHWQALARYRYRSVGGYLITPNDVGDGTYRGGPTIWERLTGRAAGGGLQPLSPVAATALRDEIRQLDVKAVVVADRPGAEAVVAVVAALLGRAGERSGGVTAWYL
jgi:hypothetical protein